MKASLPAAALLLALSAGARAGVSPTAAVALSPSAEATALSPAASAADSLYVMQEVKVVAKRDEAERRALAAAAQEALDEARLRNWTAKKVTVKDLMESITREADLGAFDLGAARIESVTQERVDSPGDPEAWKCRVVLSLRRK